MRSETWVTRISGIEAAPAAIRPKLLSCAMRRRLEGFPRALRALAPIAGAALGLFVVGVPLSASSATAQPNRPPSGVESPDAKGAPLSDAEAAAARAAVARVVEQAPPLTATPQSLLDYAGPLRVGIGVPAEILLDDTRYTFDEDGRHTVVFRRIFRLLQKEGSEKWRSVYAAYAPWLDERPQVQARVISPGGQVRVLSASAILDGPEVPPSPDVVSDRRRVLAPLPPMEVGAVVEEVIRIVHKRPYFAAGSTQRVYLSRDVPARLSRLSIDSPTALPLKTRISGFPHASKEPAADGSPSATISIVPNADGDRVTRTWTLRFLPPRARLEAGAPPDAPRGAMVAFSTGRSWEDIANAYDAIVDAKIRGAEVRGFTNGVGRVDATASESDRLAAANEVLDRVRLVIRYTGVELGEAAVVPYTPAETLARGFGDCKDQAVVLVAALRALGFDASVALLSLAPSPDVSEDLPGLGLFNHAIVHVAATSSAPAFWIDSTRPYADAGSLPIEVQGRKALIATDGQTGLVVTPKRSSSENAYVEVRTIHLAEVGPAQASEVTRATGSLRSTLRAFFDGKSDRALRARFSDYVKAEYGAAEVISIDRPPVRHPSDPFLLQLEVGAAEKFAVDSDGAFLPLQPRMAWSFLPDVLKPEAPPMPRTQALAFAEPLRAEIVYRLFLPRGFDWAAIPAPLREEVGEAVLERRVTMAPEGALEVRYVVDTGDAPLTPVQFDAFRRALVKLAVEGPVRLNLVHRGERAIEEGRIAEGLAIYRALIDGGPHQAVQHQRFADALLGLGLGQAARIHAQRAVRLAPKSAEAWASLGWVLLHDDLGRKLDPGFDREGAIAAFKRAIALRPTDAQIQANLAVALEVGDDGAAFGVGADIPGAIAAYEERRALTGEQDYDVNLLRAYFRSHRFKEIVALAPKVKRSPASDSLYIGAIAALEGPAQAIERAHWLIDVPAIRRKAIEVAGDVLPLVGKYQEAAALLRAAVRGSRDPDRLLVRAKILDDTQGFERCEFAPGHAAGPIVKEWYRALYRTDGDASVDAPLRANAGRDLAALASLRAERERAESLIDTLARRALPSRILLDAALCGTRTTVEEKGTSVVVRVRPKAFDDGAMFPAPDHQWYFADDPRSGLRLVAVADSAIGKAPSSDFGREALQQLARKNVTSARQWLDHAYANWRNDPARTTGDTLGTPPFVRFWGDASDRDRRSTAFVATAAALLSTSEPTTASVISRLERSLRDLDRRKRPNASAATVALRRAALLEGLVRAHLLLDDKQAAAAYSKRLLTVAPRSRIAYVLHNDALWRVGDLEGLKVSAKERLGHERTGDLAAQTLSSVELAQGDFVSGEQRLRLLAKADGYLKSQCYNHLAWSSLFRKGSDRDAEAALDDAISATRALKRPTPASLQTLAAVYAALDRPKEAVSALSRAVDARPGRRMIRDDYFVIGRVAESYGLIDEARAAYEKVRPDDVATLDAFDAWRLAQTRLATLAPKSNAPGPLKELAPPAERVLLEEIDRLRRASDAATARAGGGFGFDG